MRAVLCSLLLLVASRGLAEEYVRVENTVSMALKPSSPIYFQNLNFLQTELSQVSDLSLSELRFAGAKVSKEAIIYKFSSLVTKSVTDEKAGLCEVSLVFRFNPKNGGLVEFASAKSTCGQKSISIPDADSQNSVN